LFFDTQKIRPVGSNQETKINCRLIFASGRNLSNLVESEKMRKDFYYRINASQKFSLLPLRESPDCLINFCQNFSLENDVLITKNLIDFYTTLPWPGNIRQIKGHLMKKCKLTKGRKLDFDELDEELLVQSSELSTIFEKELFTLQNLKVAYAKTIYNRFEQNLSETAKKLEVSPKTLRRILNLNTQNVN
jgi:transcriptional regulator with PAS, ATPase and Fis domain